MFHGPIGWNLFLGSESGRFVLTFIFNMVFKKGGASQEVQLQWVVLQLLEVISTSIYRFLLNI